MSVLLAIDTVSDGVAVARQAGDGAPTVIAEPGPREHSTTLLRLVEKVCDGDLRSLNAIVVVRGPGAYAGIRVGIATVQALGLALGIPVLGVDTLRAVAEAAWHAGISGPTLAIHPAGRGDFAAQEFDAVGIAGPLALVRPPFGAGIAIAGEGGAEHGGHEVSAAQRVLGALAAYRKGMAVTADALYVREPHITLARTPVSGPPASEPR